MFDAVIDCACTTANTLESIRGLYAEIRRILKPGGKLFSTAFTPETTGFGTGKKLEENTYQSITEGAIAGHGIVHFTTDSEMRAILTDAGFCNIVIEKLIYTDRGNTISQLIITAERKL